MTDACPIVLDPTGRDNHAEAIRLRAQGPATRVELPGGVLAWSITGYAAAKQLLADSRVSRDPRRHWPAFINGEIPADWPLISWVSIESMFTAYGPEHARLRKLAAKAFTARRVESMRPNIEKIVADLLDELGRVPPGAVVDLRDRFAHQVPARLICDLLGLPAGAARAEIRRIVDMVANTAATPEQAAANVGDWQRAARELIAAKRQAPGDDITSDLIAVRDDGGGQLTEIELESTIFTMLGAGHQTVMDLLDSAVTALLTHPDQRALVLAGQASWDDVIEETLRVECPVEHLPLRYAVADIQLGDVTIAAGDPILIGFGPAGRDPELHGASAEQFDLTRPSKEHLAFGFGVHYCIGAALGRLEARTALPALFDRFPELTLAVPPDELEPTVTFLMNGHRALPVRLTTG
jgi:2-hydroxy-5-methyl-1-naphthoate 7-hydroxylase